jgi:Zn-dependent protease with chaperone function
VIISVYLPLLATLPMAVIASRLVRAAAPAVAARVLTGLAVLAAFATVGSLLLMVVGGFARHTQGDRVAPLDSVPAVLGVAAGAGLLAATVRLAALLRREHASADRARRVALEHVQDPDQELVVLGGAEQECQAYAVPGGWRDRDRIVVSAALLRGLDAAERRALLAHERAHLRFGHHRLALAAAVAAAVNPLLGRVRDELDYQTRTLGR